MHFILTLFNTYYITDKWIILQTYLLETIQTNTIKITSYIAITL